MSENNFCSDSLVSTIKVELEEFETEDRGYRQQADDILRSEANIFSEPIVLLERFDIKSTGISLDSAETRPATYLARKGNEGRRAIDLHTCCLCRRIYATRQTLVKHLENVHCRTTKMLCDFCPGVFYDKATINRHMLKHTSEMLTCDLCDHRSAFKHTMREHMLTHSKNVECRICGKKVSSLKAHMQFHKPKAKCPTCQRLISQTYLRNHIKRRHGTKVVCSICRRAVVKNTMKEHMKRHHCTRSCDSCGEKNFKSREELRRHKLRSHFDGKLHECHCGSVHKTKDLLESHQRSHCERIVCNGCEQEFHAVYLLNSHCRKLGCGQVGIKLKVLSRNGPFICDTCGSKFVKRYFFKKHVEKHQADSTMTCDFCQRPFSYKPFLLVHIRKAHLKLRTAFECEICKHKTFRKSALQLHMLIHKPKTECNVCSRMVSNLKIHLKTHIKAKCPICSNMYTKSNLHTHLKVHTKAALKQNLHE